MTARVPLTAPAVVIVTHRADDLLAACIESVVRQRPADVLVVVSNEHRAVSGARALQMERNVGFARAANAGIAAVSGDFLLLNDDTVIHDNCIAELTAARAATNEPTILQPRILLADGSGLDNEGHGLFPDGFVWARGRGGPDTALPGRLGGFSGAAVYFDRRAWDTLGGFDPRFDSFGEDVDMSLRWMRRGGSILPVPTAKVWHHLGASYGRTGPEKLYRIERNRVRAAVRSLPLSALATMPAWTTLRLCVFAGLAAQQKGPGAAVPWRARLAAVHGIASGLGDAPTWWADRGADRQSWNRGEWAMLHALWSSRARWEDVAR